MLDFAGPNAESQRAKRAVRGSVAVAADDGLPRLRDTQLRPDDMYDALLLAVHVKEADSGFAAIFLEGLKLHAGVRVADRQSAISGGGRAVHYRPREIGGANFACLGARAGERVCGRSFQE